MIAEITTGGNSHCLLVVCRLWIVARTMKKSEDLHDVFNLNQWDKWIRKVREIWLLKLPQKGIVLKYLPGTTGGIVMQLILGCNSKTTVVFL
jgi:hypothetical protein